MPPEAVSFVTSFQNITGTVWKDGAIMGLLKFTPELMNP
jgi:hypothetical protein